MHMTRDELLATKLDGVIRPHKGSVKIDATGTGKDDPRYDLDVKYDFTGWTVGQVLDTLATPNLWITTCRVLRTLKVEEVKAYKGKTILVSEAGKKPKEQIDVQATYMAMFAAASPEEQAKMLADLQAKAKSE
jgi:hypothetical protein